MKPSVEVGVSSLAALQAKALAADDLLIFTVYDHPLDYPDDYVIRPYSTRQAGPLTVHVKRVSLDGVRHALAALGLTCLPRAPEDDPTIVETWV